MGTPTYNSISYSIPFHLADLLPLSIHQSTLRPIQQQLNHHSKPLSHSLLLCLLPQTKKTAPSKRTTSNDPRLPALSTSQWQSRLDSRQPDWKERIRTNEMYSEGVICQWHIKKEALQDCSKIVGSTPSCPVTTSRELGLPLHTVSSRRPTTAAEVHRGPQVKPSRSSPSPAEPCIKWYTITHGWPDASPWHHTAETWTERTTRFPSGKFSLYTLCYRP